MTKASELTVGLRPPEEVMRLDRLGAAFPTRLSFMRILLRCMGQEGWRVEQKQFGLDDDGYGRAVYQVSAPTATYSLIAYSQFLDPAERTDRVIAEAWDATFVLFDGIPGPDDVERLAQEAPKQEAGRYRSSDLVLSRANKSLRLFNHVVERLSQGAQPDEELLIEIGYLMRTTAVYANGKFGLADRGTYADREALAAPFQAEMLTVYLIRCFTFDLVEHVARRRNPDDAVRLGRAYKRYLGIGNATGLGMAPFLVSHPTLIHRWFFARESALARIRSVDRAAPEAMAHFGRVLKRGVRHLDEWTVQDEGQTRRIEALRHEARMLQDWVAEIDAETVRPWDLLYVRAASAFSLEGQEFLVSLLLEPYPDLVDDLAGRLSADPEPLVDPTMTLEELAGILRERYDWVLAIDFDVPKEGRYVWYYSEEKLEPRRGERRAEIGAEQEMAVAAARDVRRLWSAVDEMSVGTVAALLRARPELRHAVNRVQITAIHAYSELRDNLVGEDCRPVDILRAKLAYFGASKFDPKSDLWTRITMYQGAPLPEEISDADDWSFPALRGAAG